MDNAFASHCTALEFNGRTMVAPYHWLQKADIHQLIRGYSPGELMSWGQLGLLEEALELRSGLPSIAVMDWRLDMLMAHLECVINPGTMRAWVLRVVLAPDFIWLGLHQAGMMDAHTPAPPNVVRHHPAVAEVMLRHKLQFDKDWSVLHSTLRLFFGSANDGSIAPASLSPGIPKADVTVAPTPMDWEPTVTPTSMDRESSVTAVQGVPTTLEPEVEEDPYERRKRIRFNYR